MGRGNRLSDLKVFMIVMSADGFCPVWRKDCCLSWWIAGCLCSFILIHSFMANCIVPIWHYKGPASSSKWFYFFIFLKNGRLWERWRMGDGGSGSRSICTIANVIAGDVFVVAKGVCTGRRRGLCLLPHPFLFSLLHTHTRTRVNTHTHTHRARNRQHIPRMGGGGAMMLHKPEMLSYI